MKRYKVAVLTVHDYTEVELLVWISHVNKSDLTPIQVSDHQQRVLLAGLGSQKLCIAHDDLGSTYVSALMYEEEGQKG